MKDFVDTILNNELRDVLVAGLVGENPDEPNKKLIDTGKYKSLKFSPIYHKIYFVFESSCYVMHDGFGNMVEFRSIETISLDFEIDEDDEFCFFSIYNQMFKTEFPVKILSVSAEDSREGTVLITYKSGENIEKVEISPLNIFGFTFY